MNKYLCLVLVVLSFLSVSAHAEPAHARGYVTITLVEFDGVKFENLEATMNVRYNQYAFGEPVFLAQLVHDGSVYISGRDSAGNQFSCLVDVEDEFYKVAYSAAANLRDGSYLNVYRKLNDTKCDRVYFLNSSAFIH